MPACPQQRPLSGLPLLAGRLRTSRGTDSLGALLVSGLQVKRVVTAGAGPGDSFLVHGVACRKSLAHKRMRSCIAQPRVMLLAGGIEVARSSSGAAAKAGAGSSGGGLASLGGSGAAGGAAGTLSKLSSFDSMLDQEQEYLGAVVDRIASFSPDVLLVERSVARCVPAQLPAASCSSSRPVAVATAAGAASCCR